MRNLLSIITILCLCLNLGFIEGTEEREVYSHTIQLSSLFPSSSSCIPSSKASNTKSSLRVVHSHGPCSHLGSGKAAKVNHDDIFRRDQERVESIRSRLSRDFADRVMQSQSRDLPVKDGETIGLAGTYIVTVGVGTPRRDLSLVFDTGSDLTWIQCKPCVKSCYSQVEPIFDPSSSSSYSNVSCSSPMCTSLGSKGVCFTPKCGYRARYGDGSLSVGFLVKEKFALKSDVFEGVYFGCGKVNSGHFKGAAGLLGLGRGKISFPSQTTKTYKNIFSYCLPSSAMYTGHLTFGSVAISNSVKFTPLSSSHSSFYDIDIVGITIGNKSIEIPPNTFLMRGAIIDSGTTITHLPQTVYAALKSAFKDRMLNYATTMGRSGLDTCYNFTGRDSIMIPSVSFTFGGGTVVEIDPQGIMYMFTESQVCLAFIANNETSHLPTIFGNHQQKTLEVVYDIAGGRVGFAPNGCR